MHAVSSGLSKFKAQYLQSIVGLEGSEWLKEQLYSAVASGCIFGSLFKYQANDNKCC